MNVHIDEGKFLGGFLTPALLNKKAPSSPYLETKRLIVHSWYHSSSEHLYNVLHSCIYNGISRLDLLYALTIWFNQGTPRRVGSRMLLSCTNRQFSENTKTLNTPNLCSFNIHVKSHSITLHRILSRSNLFSLKF